MSLKKKNFFITTAGSIFLVGCTCIIYSVTTLGVYFVSRAKWHGGKVNLQWTNLMNITFIFLLIVTYPVAGFINARYGNYKPMIFGGIIWLIGGLLLLFFTQIYFIELALVLCGFSIALLYTIPLKNCCLYYGKYKGTIVSIFESLTTVMEVCFNILGEMLVNPKGKVTEDGYYDKETSDNIWKFAVAVCVTGVVGVFVGLITFRPYKKEYEDSEPKKVDNENNKAEEDDKVISTGDEKAKEELLTKKEEGPNNPKKEEANTPKKTPKNEEDDEEEEEEVIIDPEVYKKNIKMALTSKRLWLIIGISCTSEVMHTFNQETFRTLAAVLQTDKKDGRVVQFLPNINLIAYIIGSTVIGILYDFLGYKKVMFAYIIISIVGGILLSCFMQIKVIFDIIVAISGFVVGGGIVIIGSHIIDVFGAGYMIEINGIEALFTGIFEMLINSISFIYAFFFESNEELIWPYRGVYIATTCIELIAFFLQFYDSEEAFDYNASEKEISEIEKIRLSQCENEDAINCKNN